MDSFKNSLLLPDNSEMSKSENTGDTALHLNCLGHGFSGTARFPSNQNNLGASAPGDANDGCTLVLGLGPTSSAYSNSYYNAGCNKNKDLATASPWELPYGSDSVLQLGLSGGSKEASSLCVPESTGCTETDLDTCIFNKLSNDNGLFIPILDEGSTSAKKSGGYIPSLLLAPRTDKGKQCLQTQEFFEFGTKQQCHLSQISRGQSSTTDISLSSISEQVTTGTSSARKHGSTKICMFPGCPKGARGSSGLCIGHGGGQRCQRPGCTKGAESRTVFCKAHGGGRRCEYLGCTKSAEGKTDYCIAHGGGRRCQFSGGCTKAARGKSGLCIRHGGGKRCKVDGCTRSAEGQPGLCISHGGGRRCQYPGCIKGSQGSTLLCKAHGGGKRCIFAGCTKGAEGSTPLCKAHGGGKRCMFEGGAICPKSVHGGTNFCVAHGGGKRCAVPGCTKSARGRTDCCVRHGGGKRCMFENCGKSAQGSTDFCKAHGGGKRCNWGDGNCEKFSRGRNGLCAAHSSMAQQQESKKGGFIAPGLFHGIVPAASTTITSLENNNSISGVSILSDGVDPIERSQIQQLIPSQVLVPRSMKSSLPHAALFNAPEQHVARNSYNIGIGLGRTEDRPSLNFEIPEGRVHGGGLMALLRGNLRNASDGFINL